VVFRSLILANSLVVAISAPAMAQDFKLGVDLFGQKKPAAPKPPAIDWSRGPATDPNATPTPKVVCGMMMIPADPKVDPKMRFAPPDNGVNYALKVVPPAVCKP